MRIGACLLMLRTQEDPAAAYAIPVLSRAGTDYAEVSLSQLMRMDEKQLADYKKAFDNAELPVEASNNSIPQGLNLVGPNRDPEALESFINKAVSLAEYFGVTVITMCGPLKEMAPAGYSWEEEGFAQYVDFMKRYADLAAAKGITLAIEPINDEEEGFISTVAEAKRVIDACGKDNVRIIVDTYHFIKQGDDWTLLRDLCLEGMVAHVHFAAQAKRSYPLEDDEEECRRTLLTLLEAGFSGRVSIEARTTDVEKDAPVSVALLKGIKPARRVKVQELTEEAFAPYGTVVRSPADYSKHEHFHCEKFDFFPYVGGTLNSDCGQMAVGVSDHNRRPLLMHTMERHFHTQELMVPFGHPVILTFAKNEGTDENEKPDIQKLAAFLVHPNEGVVVNPNIWHWTPFCVEADTSVLTIFAPKTGETDCPEVDFPGLELAELVLED